MSILLLLISLGHFLSLLSLYIIPGWFSLPIVVEIAPESTFPMRNFLSNSRFKSYPAPLTSLVVSGMLQTFFSDFQVLHTAALGTLSGLNFWSQTDDGLKS